MQTFQLPDGITVAGVNGFGGGPFYSPNHNTITYQYGFVDLIDQTLRKLHPEWSEYRVGLGIGAVSSFILEHEFAHALVAIYELPVLGREEDAADDLAVLLLLKADSGEQFALDAAQFWEALSRRQRIPAISDYADVHSFDLQRAYEIACLVAGSSRESFQRARRAHVLPVTRLGGCPAEYRQKVQSFENVLEPEVGEDLNLAR